MNCVRITIRCSLIFMDTTTVSNTTRCRTSVLGSSISRTSSRTVILSLGIAMWGLHCLPINNSTGFLLHLATISIPANRSTSWLCLPRSTLFELVIYSCLAMTLLILCLFSDNRLALEHLNLRSTNSSHNDVVVIVLMIYGKCMILNVSPELLHFVNKARLAQCGPHRNHMSVR